MGVLMVSQNHSKETLILHTDQEYIIPSNARVNVIDLDLKWSFICL